MRLILLPAFDGTGLMFGPFIRELKNLFATWVISYPVSGSQDYHTLAEYIRRQIPANEVSAVSIPMGEARKPCSGPRGSPGNTCQMIAR